MTFVNQMILDKGTIKPPKTARKGYRVKHCRGLYLSVSASGHKSWIVMYRVNKGKQIKETLGTIDKIPMLDEAVRLARAIQDKAHKGVDPKAERKAEAERAAAEAHRLAANTLGAAVDEYLEHCERGLRAKTVAGYRQVFRHDVMSRWATRPLSSITKRDILELLHDKANNRDRKRKDSIGGAVVQANRLLTRLRTFFKWCISEDKITVDPTSGIMKPLKKEKARDRVLSDDEIRALWTATEGWSRKRANGVPWGAMFRLLLLTAQRKNEVAGMQWSEIDLDAKQWVIPGARTKNSKVHIVALSKLAIEQLAQLPRNGSMVFSGTRKTPASGWSRAKASLDKAMGASDWVIHDLRRTVTTGMARLNIPPHVADKVLNHTQGTIHGVAKVYNQFEYLDERKSALDAYSNFIEQLVRPSGETNVVEMARRA